MINLKPIMTEKAHAQMPSGVYTFFVSKSATKNDIKKAVKELFSVDVVSINVASTKPKQRRIARTRKFTSVGGNVKKALVQIKAGQTIAMLSPKTETKSKKTQKNSAEKDVQQVKVEVKEGA